MTQVYSFGLNINGQLGHGNEDNQLSPKLIEALKGKKIVHIAAGLHHTVAITDTGEVFSWGDNEHGELGRGGRQRIPISIESLESMVVTQIACGDSHTLACTNLGVVLTWGSNDCGQLGLGDIEPRIRPHTVKELKNQQIVQVAAGSKHSMFLTPHGEVFACGKGRDGQLGMKDNEDRRWPRMMDYLWGKPIVSMSAGESHSVVLSISGSVYSFGSNKFGQLGLGSEIEARNVPTLVSHLHSITDIQCGSNHTVAISSKGPVYTFGNGMFYQLGHKGTNNEVFPTVLFELMGSKILSVAAGQKHTIALRSSVNEGDAPTVLSWGNNSNGQLGTGDTQPKILPTIIESVKGLPVANVFAGRMTSFLLTSEEPIAKKQKLERLTLSKIREAIDHSDNQNYKELEKLILSVFSHPGSVNGSFIKEDEVLDTSLTLSGLDLVAVREAYTRILSISSPSVMVTLANATNKLLSDLKKVNADNPEALRVYLVLFENPLLLNASKQNLLLLEKLASAIVGLSDTGKKILFSWLRRMSSEYFIRVVHIFQKFLSFSITMSLDSQAVSAALVLNDLYRANEEASVIPYNQFYNHEVSTKKDLREDYRQWKQSPNVFSFLRYPFLLDPAAKTNILHYDAAEQMQQEVENSLYVSIATGKAASPFLILPIRRDHLVEDSLNNLSVQPVRAFKKPLKIVFMGEEGIDEGGLRKEFFQLIVKQLFDLNYGMFVYNDETDTYWFNSNSLETELQFTLVGIIMGLAIYNGDILDVRFPRVVYKKLLGIKPTMNDLKDAFPHLVFSFQKLLEYEGDVEFDFDLTFQVAVDYFGQKKLVDLKPDGGNINVTNTNRREYVDLYTKYILEDSIASQFAAFSKGFMLVGGGPLLNLFRPEELELLICGNPEDPDFKALEKVTKYEGFTADHPVIKNFWEVVHSLPVTEQKKLLLFVSGSDRVPIRGLGNTRFIIQKNGPDSDRLPNASTCFNILLLPEYSSKDKLREKLIRAIEVGTEGFGLK